MPKVTQAEFLERVNEIYKEAIRLLRSEKTLTLEEVNLKIASALTKMAEVLTHEEFVHVIDAIATDPTMPWPLRNLAVEIQSTGKTKH